MRRGSARTRFFVMVGVMLSYVAVLILLPLAIPFDVNATELSASLTPPGSEGHVLGCDSMGRDVLARTLAGGSESVLLGLAIMAGAVLGGCAVGLAAGFFGGAVDYVLSRVITAFQAFPSFVLAVAIAGILGQGTINMIIAIAAVYWTQYARLTRSIAIAFKQSECVSAARMCGARAGALMMRYFVPEMAGCGVVRCLDERHRAHHGGAFVYRTRTGAAYQRMGRHDVRGPGHVPVCAMVHAGAYGGAVYNCCSFQFTWRYLA